MMAQGGGAQGTPGQAAKDKQLEDNKAKLNKGGKTEERKEDDQWLQELVRVKDLYEKQHEENEKLRRDLLRRNQRYAKNEQEYRKELDLLQRELRVRYGNEKDVKETNMAAITLLKEDIHENIDSLEDKVRLLYDQQYQELARKYESQVTKINADIRNKVFEKQGNQASLMRQEEEYRRKLELITNIAQRIDNENRALRKKNRELKSEYRAQCNDRELLVKNLVLQKKENEKMTEEITDMETLIEQHKREEDGEMVDLDKLDGSLKSVAGRAQNSALGRTTEGRAPTAASKLKSNFGHTPSVAGQPNWNASAFMNRPSLMSQQSGPIIYQPKAKQETEEDKIRRYERVIEKLRKMMEHERRQLKGARLQYNKELNQKTELEVLLRQSVEKVKRERKLQAKNAEKKEYNTKHHGLGVQVTNVPQSADAPLDEDIELDLHERERVIELLLAQERVIAILYERTFPMTSADETGNPKTADQQQMQDHINNIQQRRMKEEAHDEPHM